MLFRARIKHTDTIANVTLIYLSLPLLSCRCLCSGALRATASGDPARSLRDTTGAGDPGQSLAPAPERAEAAFAPAAGSAPTLRESRSSEENLPAQMVYTDRVFVHVRVRSQSWVRFWSSSGSEHTCLDAQQEAEAAGILSAVASHSVWRYRTLLLFRKKNDKSWAS